MYTVLTKLAAVKPEFIFAMGRLEDDFLPPVQELFVGNISTFTALESKLALAMASFIQECSL